MELTVMKRITWPIYHCTEKVGMDFCRGRPCQHPCKEIYPLFAGIPCQVPYKPLPLLTKIRPLPRPIQKWTPHSKTHSKILTLSKTPAKCSPATPCQSTPLQASLPLTMPSPAIKHDPPINHSPCHPLPSNTTPPQFHHSPCHPLPSNTTPPQFQLLSNQTLFCFCVVLVLF